MERVHVQGMTATPVFTTDPPEAVLQSDTQGQTAADVWREKEAENQK